MISPHFYLVIILLKANIPLLVEPLSVNYIFVPPMIAEETYGYGLPVDASDQLSFEDYGVQPNKAYAIPIYDPDFDKKLDEVTISFSNPEKIEEEFGQVPEYDFTTNQEVIVDNTKPKI